jgi:glycosyltransferase involved in cell wall biosynthesis
MSKVGAQLSVVIPMFNEIRALPALVEQLTKQFPTAETEIFLVDDGSTDDTPGLATHLTKGDDRFEVVRLPQNLGKGAALRAGIARTTADAVLFMDADLSTSLHDLDAFLEQLKSFDIVIGSRAVAGASVSRSNRLRSLMGGSFNVLMRLGTGLNIRDSQCGFKAFRGDVARLIFALSENNRFTIDPEILRIGFALGYSIEEVPVVWVASDYSAVRPVRDSVRAAFDLVSICIRTRRSRIQGLASRSNIPKPLALAEKNEHENLD